MIYYTFLAFLWLCSFLKTLFISLIYFVWDFSIWREPVYSKDKCGFLYHESDGDLAYWNEEYYEWPSAWSALFCLNNYKLMK